MNTELFDLKVGYVKLKNPIALAPMGGVTDSSFVNNHAKEAGLVTIGGYNIDESTKKLQIICYSVAEKNLCCKIH